MWKKTMAFALKRSSTPVAGFHPTPYPADLTELDGLDLMARYRAGRRGGNFFDGLAIGQRVVFLLTDIAGARAEARALAVDLQTAFRQCAPKLFGPSGANESEAIATLAYELNRSLIEAARGVHFAPPPFWVVSASHWVSSPTTMQVFSPYFTMRREHEPFSQAACRWASSPTTPMSRRFWHSRPEPGCCL